MHANKIKCHKWVEVESEIRDVWLKTFSLIYSLNKYEWNAHMCKTNIVEIEQTQDKRSELTELVF